MIVRDKHGDIVGSFEVRILDVIFVPGVQNSAVIRPYSPYRNLAHWLNFKRATKSQLANDEPANLPGVGTKWKG